MSLLIQYYTDTKQNCEMCVSQDGVAINPCVLSCCHVLTSKQGQAFQGEIDVHLEVQEEVDCLTMKRRAIRSFETSVNI